jgi:hypothetical protein
MWLEIGEQMVKGNVAKALKKQDLLVNGDTHDSPEMASANERLKIIRATGLGERVRSSW